MDTSMLLATLVCLAILVAALLYFLQNNSTGKTATAETNAKGEGGKERAKQAGAPRRRGLDRLQRGGGEAEAPQLGE